MKRFAQNIARKISFGIMKMAGLADPINFRSWETGADLGIRRNPAAWLKEFGEHALLYPPVNRIAKDVSGNGWGLYKLSPDGKKTAVADHPALAVFMNPCPEYGFLGSQIRYLVQAWLDLVGEGFLLIMRDADGSPSQLFPVSPSEIIQRPMKQNGYKYKVRLSFSNEIATIEGQNIIRFFYPDPAKPYGPGQGTAFALDDEITGDTYAAKWNLTTFRNSAMPASIISVAGYNKDALERLQVEWNENHQGIWSANKTSFTNEETKVLHLSKNQKEMEFIKGRLLNRDLIHQCFNIPPEIMGVVENSNRATADAAMVLYQTNLLRPRLEYFKEVFNSQFLPQFPGAEGLFFDFEDPVMESKQFIADRAEKAFVRGAITQNEYRREIGKDPVSGGDIFLIPLNAQVVQVGDTPSGEAKNKKPGNGKSLEVAIEKV